MDPICHNSESFNSIDILNRDVEEQTVAVDANHQQIDLHADFGGIMRIAELSGHVKNGSPYCTRGAISPRICNLIKSDQ